MRFMNEFDIETALSRFDYDETPNRAMLAKVVSALAEWANYNSDGWHSWPKPARAAARAMEQIDPVTWADIQRMESEDCTKAEYDAAMRPIKAFLTRQGTSLERVLDQ
jgi:hypothetical protein